MIENARSSKATSDFTAQAASDATFGTADTAIATAKAAGKYNVTLTTGNWTPQLQRFLIDKGHEVKLLADNVSLFVDWSNPTDASFI